MKLPLSLALTLAVAPADAGAPLDAVVEMIRAAKPTPLEVARALGEVSSTELNSGWLVKPTGTAFTGAVVREWPFDVELTLSPGRPWALTELTADASHWRPSSTGISPLARDWDMEQLTIRCLVNVKGAGVVSDAHVRCQVRLLGETIEGLMQKLATATLTAASVGQSLGTLLPPKNERVQVRLGDRPFSKAEVSASNGVFFTIGFSQEGLRLAQWSTELAAWRAVNRAAALRGRDLVASRDWHFEKLEAHCSVPIEDVTTPVAQWRVAQASTVSCRLTSKP